MDAGAVGQLAELKFRQGERNDVHTFVPNYTQLTEAEVRYLMTREWARFPEDVLWRRTKLGLHLLNVDAGPLERWLEAGGGAA